MTLTAQAHVSDAACPIGVGRHILPSEAAGQRRAAPSQGETTMETMMDEKRQQLTDNLRTALNELIRAYADKSNQRSWGNFLADSLARYADEGTIERVLADLRQHLTHLDDQRP
jgi:hypothetical protein